MLKSGKCSVVFKPTESTGGLCAFPMKLPCGQCIGCRLDYSLDWATRCIHESQMHEENCFVTLTYDDKNRPKDGGLVLADFQKFMKRLRKRFVGKKIRFFHAGEYGEKFGRPHYHALLFGVNFSDRVPLKVTGSGSTIDTSKVLSELWPYGFSSVGDVTFESAAYVARYCLKKINGGAREVVGDDGLRPYERLDVDSGVVSEVRSEYVTMSRRPGIARAWFDKYRKDVYPGDYVVVRGGVKMPPPRYYDGLYELIDPLDMERIKLHRVERCGGKEEVWNDVLQKFQKLDRSRDDRLRVMEEVKVAQVGLLKRKVDSGQ